MVKRTSKEIENDYKRIKDFISSNNVTSLKEVALGLELSVTEVRTSLSKHPKVHKRLLNELNSNRVKKREERRAIAEKETEEHIDSEENEVKIVIDASITGIPFLRERISEVKKVIITSVTLKELNEMQQFSDPQGNDAKYLMASAAENPEKFELIPIEENSPVADECIINYCTINKNNVILWTSDKNMLLTARMLGVTTEYFKQEKPVVKNSITLWFAKKIGNKLFVSDFNTEKRSVMLISNGNVYTDGTHCLNIGDDIYISAKKEGYITFAHYHVISLDVTDNAKMVFSKRIYYSCDIDLLPELYVDFVKNFKARFAW